METKTMFRKVLIANRGEIAVRIIRTCREMGLSTVALYETADRGSLHVRLADECAAVPDHHAFLDAALLIRLAQQHGADAIHPGYGFLAEDPEFIRACDEVGITFLGPPVEVVARTRNKIGALQTVRAAGIPTVMFSEQSFSEDEGAALQRTAEVIGYPLVLKSCSGGRGRGERLVTRPEQLAEATRRSRAEARTIYGNQQLYLERAILPAHQVGVQIMGDAAGNLIHLGEREGSLIQHNQKIVEESPALCLTPERRAELLETALRIGRLFNYRNLGTVEFLVDESGAFYFSEIKARIQIEHTLTEMRTRLDLVREQVRLAAGEPLIISQDDLHLDGWAMMCRVQAEDPANAFLPSPGRLRRVRLPGGPEVRVDTYIYCQADIPAAYDPIVAKVTAWAPDREQCINRMRRALEDFTVIGTPTNLPFLLRIFHAPEFIGGRYTTDFLSHPFEETAPPEAAVTRRDLAVIAAVVYALRREAFNPKQPERVASAWHRDSRRLPQ
jgi:acetyl/propionyl-CoA carboxylase alpha subunit